MLFHKVAQRVHATAVAADRIDYKSIFIDSLTEESNLQYIHRHSVAWLHGMNYSTTFDRLRLLHIMASSRSGNNGDVDDLDQLLDRVSNTLTRQHVSSYSY